MAIVAGGVMAHTLVPPTPGPLFVAAELGIDLGVMMIAVLALGVVTASCGFAYGWWANRRWPIPVRETPEVSIEELEAMSVRPDEELPSFAVSVLPIVLPVVLIAGGTVLGATLGAIDAPAPWQATLLKVFRGFGNSTVALTIAAVVDSRRRCVGRGSATNRYRPPHRGAGHRLQHRGVAAGLHGDCVCAHGAGLGDRLDDHRYLALAIGCGSKPIPWMNDSGFWVVGKMSGLTEAETLKTFSTELTLMGFAGIAVVMVAAKMLPLV
jgi:GntP family gluconate:H+ symporter